MKKILLMAALMVATLGAKAQNAVGEVTLKPMVGMTIANITKVDGDSKIGLAAGVEAEYGLANNFGITAGLVYSMQGTKYDETIAGTNATLKINNDYLNIPILANFYVAPGLAIKAGIQPGFNVRSEAKAEVAGKDIDYDDLDVKSFDFSIPVGLSYEFSSVVIDARYQWGLTKIWDDSDAKNSVFMISLGYKFAL